MLRIFPKISHFLNFWDKSKLALSCTTAIYVLSMCKGKIKFLEGLRRYRILQVHIRNFKFFQRILISSIFKKKKPKLTPPSPVAQLQIYVLYICKSKIKSVEGLHKFMLKSVDTRTNGTDRTEYYSPPTPC